MIQDRFAPCPASAVRAATAVAVLAVVASAIPAAAQQGAYAFTDVTVIPMDRFGVLERRTVLVRDGIVQEVDDQDRTEVPADATVIDGQGRFLLPGLAEMHAHIPGGGAEPELVEDLLFLYVANGVTTIRGMLGDPSQFALRRRVLRGEVLGPSIYLAAPSINGNTAPTPDSVETLVRRYAGEGWDLLKIHPGLTRDVWDRMTGTAVEEGITFGGHVPREVGLRHALATGISTVDHMDGYVIEVTADSIQEGLDPEDPVPWSRILPTVRDRQIRAIAGRTRAASTWVVPTLYLWQNLYGPADSDSMAALPEMRYVPGEMRRGWVRQNENRTPLSPEDAALLADVRKRIVKALNDAGVGILMGTDSPQMFNVPGFSLHRELQVMREAGLTPYEVLRSGSRNVARYAEEELGEPGEFGVVAAGMRADLILLEENPLDDLAALRDARAGVMVRGRWIGPDEIEAGLRALAEKYGG